MYLLLEKGGCPLPMLFTGGLNGGSKSWLKICTPSLYHYRMRKHFPDFPYRMRKNQHPFYMVCSCARGTIMGDENITSYHLILTYGTWIDFAWQFSNGFANDWRLFAMLAPRPKPDDVCETTVAYSLFPGWTTDVEMFIISWHTPCHLSLQRWKELNSCLRIDFEDFEILPTTIIALCMMFLSIHQFVENDFPRCNDFPISPAYVGSTLPPSDSHHQDSYIFRIGNLYKLSFVTGNPGNRGGRSKAIWVFPKIGVPPNHPILIGFSIIINHPFWGTPIFDVWKHPYGFNLSMSLTKKSPWSSVQKKTRPAWKVVEGGSAVMEGSWYQNLGFKRLEWNGPFSWWRYIWSVLWFQNLGQCIVEGKSYPWNHKKNTAIFIYNLNCV